MSHSDPVAWSPYLRQTLERYDEVLLRQVAARLAKPRGHWPAAELIERCVAAAGDVAVIDRRLKDLGPSERRLLAVFALSGQPRWQFGDLVWLAVALGETDPVAPVKTLLQAGLIYPDLVQQDLSGVADFEQWLGRGGLRGSPVFASPSVSTRCLAEVQQWPACPAAEESPGVVQEADGLQFPLRLAAYWQLLAEAPLRRTQQGDFFKRDLDRLNQDARLSGGSAEGLAELPDSVLLVAQLAQLLGISRQIEAEVHPETLSEIWQDDLPALLRQIWSVLPCVESWNPHRGGASPTASGNPYPSACFLALALLACLPEDSWARPADVEQWVIGHHPYWPARKPQEVGLQTFLLGLAFPLRLVQAGKATEGTWLVRLTPLARGLLGLAAMPPALPEYVQTLMVQPNLEIVAYRQGMTPALIARLSRFALWTNLGTACTLQLRPELVYRALETGLAFEDIRQTLEQHGMRPVPQAVLDALRTWAGKRDRIAVHGSATLFEFATAEDLNEALARGLPAVRLTDRLALVADESGIDFRHFRLTGTRDYGLPPEKCVEVAADGVTLNVDLARSDLFLESELRRFAEPAEAAAVNGRRRYRVTPATLASGKSGGMDLRSLEDWFTARTGQALPPACRLLLNAAGIPSPQLRPLLVLRVDDPAIADGLCQWPATRTLIEDRLGPTALAVAEENAAALRQQLAALGIVVESG